MVNNYDEIGRLYLDAQGKYFEWVCASVHGDDNKKYREFNEAEKKLFEKIMEVCMKVESKEGGKIHVG